nr:MAG TPA: hypothetical protein [Caudoviricetes sp.]
MEYYGIHYDSVIEHHGIKGQKWGVRRYQNPDGTLTDEGKKRLGFSFTNPFAKHKQNLVDKYVSLGYSESAAQEKAKQRIKTELVVGAVATVAVAVIAKKAATRIGQDYVDKTIKAGKTIQNIGVNPDASFKDAPFYATVNKHDKNAYRMLFPRDKRNFAIAFDNMSDFNVYNNKIKVTRDLKVPSVNTAKKIFGETVSTDSEFKKNVLEAIAGADIDADNVNVHRIFKRQKLAETNPKKLYNEFNRYLATGQVREKGLDTKFYSELRKRGYGALLDINDSRYSGYAYIAKSPTIFFGKDAVEKVSNTLIPDSDIDKNFKKYIAGVKAKRVGKRAAVIGSGVAVGKTLSERRRVNKYLEEHPNTELSREEILKALKTKNKE